VEAIETDNFSETFPKTALFVSLTQTVFVAATFAGLADSGCGKVGVGLIPFACKVNPIPPTKKHILYKKRIMLFKLLSAIKIHA
jgi:hypothetical protein